MTSGNMIPPKEQMVMARDFVVRRSELTVPGHSLKMMAKAATSNTDQVMFDLEDACAVSQKVEARKMVVEALNTLDFKGKIRAFRPNNIRTRYFYRDLIEVVEAQPLTEEFGGEAASLGIGEHALDLRAQVLRIIQFTSGRGALLSTW